MDTETCTHAYALYKMVVESIRVIRTLTGLVSTHAMLNMLNAVTSLVANSPIKHGAY